MYKLLIVEDDMTIAQLLAHNLGHWGFESHIVTDFNAVGEDFRAVSPHLVLLDVALPFYNGYYWCAEIRKISQVPLIFLSSRSDNMDIVMAVNMGGDDYITKPFSMEVLIAKINALLRRSYSYQEGPPILMAGGAMLSPAAGTISFAGQTAELTKNELRILAILMEQKGKIVSREQMIKKLWDDESFIDDNTLTVNINRLRKRLADIGLIDFIFTKKGLGYLIDA